MAKKQYTKKEENVSVTSDIQAEYKKPVNLLTAKQAWKTIGGNRRLSLFVEKKFKEQNSLEDWIKIFDKEGLK